MLRHILLWLFIAFALASPVQAQIITPGGGGSVDISTGVTGLGAGVSALLGGASSGTSGPAGTVSPTFTGTLNGAAAQYSGDVLFDGVTARVAAAVYKTVSTGSFCFVTSSTTTSGACEVAISRLSANVLGVNGGWTATGQLIGKGTATNDDATAGQIGEYISQSIAFGSAVSLTTLTSANIASVSLTAGDWEVCANFADNPGGSTLTVNVIAAISTTSNTLPTIPAGGAYVDVYGASVSGAVFISPVGCTRASLSSTTTEYLVANINFSVSTMGGYGIIWARRLR